MKLPADAAPVSWSIPRADAWRIRWRSTTSKQIDTSCSGRRLLFQVGSGGLARGGRYHLRQECCLWGQTACSAQDHPLPLPIVAGCSSTGLSLLGAAGHRKRGVLCVGTRGCFILPHTTKKRPLEWLVRGNTLMLLHHTTALQCLKKWLHFLNLCMIPQGHCCGSRSLSPSLLVPTKSKQNMFSP